MAKINVNCPHCQHEFQIGDEWAGMGILCPSCKNCLTVPKKRNKKQRSTTMTKFNRTQEPDSDAEDQQEEAEDNGTAGFGAGTIAIGMNLIGIIMMWLDLEYFWIFMAIGGIIFMLSLLPDFIKRGW